MIDENGSFLRNFSESNYNDLSTFDFNVRLLDGQQINVNTTLIPYSLLEKCPINKNLQDPAAIDYDFFKGWDFTRYKISFNCPVSC